jgi:DUF4097 and DUF4098 domain-containing protein YvlB
MSFRSAVPIGRVSRLAAPLVALGLSLVGAAACHVDFDTGVEARDEWKRTYTLGKNGAFELRNTNGKIQIQAADGDVVEVNATRIVKARTDEAAKDALARFEIRETVSPASIALDSTNRGGFEINMSRRVEYTVRVPRWAAVRVSTTNAEVDVTGVGGALQIEATNGRIRGRALENSASVETTNGTVALEFARLGERGVSCDTTNGTIELTVPDGAKANLTARVTNGAITTTGLDMTVIEQSRRRLDASIGGGGPEIKLETTNGAIRIMSRRPQSR